MIEGVCVCVSFLVYMKESLAFKRNMLRELLHWCCTFGAPFGFVVEVLSDLN